jgi:hypothetical protein
VQGFAWNLSPELRRSSPSFAALHSLVPTARGSGIHR